VIFALPAQFRTFSCDFSFIIAIFHPSTIPLAATHRLSERLMHDSGMHVFVSDFISSV
jgi:hypothetical protein